MGTSTATATITKVEKPKTVNALKACSRGAAKQGRGGPKSNNSVMTGRVLVGYTLVLEE